MIALRDRKTPRPKALAATWIAGLLLLPAPAFAQSPSDEGTPPSRYAAMALDAVIVRPCGLAALLVGAALFIPTAVVTSPGGRDSIEEALDILVMPQWEFVVMRPLGEF